MTEQEKKNALSIVWDALHADDGDEQWDDEAWDKICGAMANITEELGLDSGECHD
tara:strand:- start:875 stop:1039 length:165 start_codon:yes stop_codon:yes gene_type:complete